jgi:hypothetical protein
MLGQRPGINQRQHLLNGVRNGFIAAGLPPRDGLGAGVAGMLKANPLGVYQS